MVTTAPRIQPFGESALLVTLGDQASIPSARHARVLAEAVDRLRSEDDRWEPAIAAAASVLVPFDPFRIDEVEARAALERLMVGLPAVVPDDPDARLHEIAVRYGAGDGPDLEDVARETGLRPEEVVALHGSVEYEVLFLGFQPGFAYLGELPARLRLPRLETPRVRVEAGSVGIADRTTGIYPAASPGGWRILGRAAVRLFDPEASEPALLRPGDRVRFVPLVRA